MITLLLNVNIQYLLHFQINLFLFTLSSSSPPTKKKIKITGTDETDLCKARTSRGRCIAEDLFVHLNMM